MLNRKKRRRKELNHFLLENNLHIITGPIQEDAYGDRYFSQVRKNATEVMAEGYGVSIEESVVNALSMMSIDDDTDLYMEERKKGWF